MKFICTQKNLQKGLFNIAHIAGKNSTLPILNNVLIETDKGRLKLSSTDLEIGVNSWVRGKSEKQGSVAIPVKILSNYVNNLPEEKITLEVKKKNILSLTTQNFNAEIKGFDVKDFPIIPKIEGKEILKLKASSFKDDLSSVVFAASQDESRPEITGVYFKFSKSNIITTATDSYRLVEKTIIQEKSIEGTKTVIVPSKTIYELIRLINEDTENIEIKINENQILFILDDIFLTSRLIEGKYPDYKQIIPEDYLTRAKVNLNEFLRVVKTSSLFAKPGIYDISIEFKKEGKIIVTSDTDQIGRASASLNAEVEGESQKINFNYHYILEGLSNINTREIFFEITNESSPGVIKPVGKKNYIYIIMPIKA